MKKIIAILIISMMTMTTVFAQTRSYNRNSRSYTSRTYMSTAYRGGSYGASTTRSTTYVLPASRTKSVSIPSSRSNQTPTVARPTESVRHYTNNQGQRVQSPTRYTSVPAGATARCKDGTFSFSRSKRGTCSHHGGVAEWL